MNIYQMHSEKNAELVKHVKKLLAESSLKQDSLINEIDKLKLGIEESSIRKYKVTNGQLIIRDVRPDFNELECLRLATLIYDECDRIGVKYSYALALIQAESRFNYKALSNVGARGLMQIMPSTFVSIARRYGYPYEEGDIYDLKKNIKIGILYIYILKQKYDRSELVSAGYNGGPKIAANYRLYMNGDNSAFIPPETMKYVGSVNKNYQKYRKILGE
jgi:soluble lytic murein transglycosylase